MPSKTPGCTRHGLPGCPVCPAPPPGPTGAERVGRALAIVVAGVGGFVGRVLMDLVMFAAPSALFGYLGMLIAAVGGVHGIGYFKFLAVGMAVRLLVTFVVMTARDTKKEEK